MSAYLDKTQGVTFVFSNIHELYKKAKNAKLDDPFLAEMPRVIKGSTEARFEPFKPEEIKPKAGERTFPVPMGVREAEEKAKRLSMRPVAKIQKNLNELTDAHEKLRFLLQELDALTKKKN